MSLTISAVEKFSDSKITGTGKTYISGFNFSNREVEYSIIDGYAILEGDIILGTLKEVESWAKKNTKSDPKGVQSIIITGSSFRWENNIIPYELSPDLPQGTMNDIEEAIQHWEQYTEVTFIERTNLNAGNYPDYVHFIDSTGCSSSVGRIGGMQELNLAENCGFGAAVHEIGHAFGLWHEQSREDRENFVRINYENIEQDQTYNFDKNIDDADDLCTYDYSSIMHYSSNAFSNNGLPTIEPIDLDGNVRNDVLIGQRTGLSENDIYSIETIASNSFAQTECQSFTIFNDGNSTLFISDISPEIQAPWLSIFPTTATVEPDSYIFIRVAIKYTEAPKGTDDIRLVVSSNDPEGNVYLNVSVINPEADLGINQSASTNPVTAGTSFNYVLSISNDGPSTASNVKVQDALPSEVAFSHATGDGWSCSTDSGIVTCTRPSLAVGDAPDITIGVVAPTQAGVLSNSVNISSDTSDGALDNNMVVISTITIADLDQDGIADVIDNCSLISNPNQANFDGDSSGDACDTDDDGDGVLDYSDAFPLDANESVDTDGDGIGDNSDNCKLVKNGDQFDSNGNGIGNACEEDDGFSVILSIIKQAMDQQPNPP